VLDITVYHYYSYSMYRIAKVGNSKHQNLANYLSAMKKANQIVTNCKQLVKNDHPQPLAFEMPHYRNKASPKSARTTVTNAAPRLVAEPWNVTIEDG